VWPGTGAAAGTRLEKLLLAQGLLGYAWSVRKLVHAIGDNFCHLHHLLAQCRVFRNIALNTITVVLPRSVCSSLMRLSIPCIEVSETLPSKLLRLSGVASPSIGLARRKAVMPRGNGRKCSSASIACDFPISAGPNGVLAKLMIVSPISNRSQYRAGPNGSITRLRGWVVIEPPWPAGWATRPART